MEEITIIDIVKEYLKKNLRVTVWHDTYPDTEITVTLHLDDEVISEDRVYIPYKRDYDE